MNEGQNGTHIRNADFQIGVHSFLFDMVSNEKEKERVSCF